MIKITCDNGHPTVVAQTRGYSVYLDNWSITELAQGCSSRRERFVHALRSKCTLLFSWANAVEVIDNRAGSVRDFLNSIGPHWVPLSSNPWEVARREEAGVTNGVVVSESFIRAYFLERIEALSPMRGGVIDLSSENFFKLGAFLDWIQTNRDRIRMHCDPVYDALRELIAYLSVGYNQDASSLDRRLPFISFDSCRPANFVLVHLQRLLIREAKAFTLKRSDGLDFCHAVLAAAYGNFVTLDGGWKRRIDNLPCANELAQTYSFHELDQFVAKLEEMPISGAIR